MTSRVSGSSFAAHLGPMEYDRQVMRAFTWGGWFWDPYRSMGMPRLQDLGMTELAEKHFQQAGQLDPGDRVTHDAFGMGTVVAVTHDRYFLDNVAGWILELDRGKGIPYEGNYSSWLEQKQKRLAQEGREEQAHPSHMGPRRRGRRRSRRAASRTPSRPGGARTDPRAGRATRG